MNYTKLLLTTFLICLLSACSSLGLGASQRGANMGDTKQTFKLMLLGGGALNMSADGVARPVQVCVYVVRNRDWEAPLIRHQSTCVESSADANVVYSKRVLLAPLHMNHVVLPLEAGRDAWLIMDPDFSQLSANRARYVFPINAQSEALQVVLNGNELFQNQAADRHPAFASSPTERTEASGASPQPMQRIKPLVRQAVTSPSSINVKQQGQSYLWDELNKRMDGTP